MTDTTTEEIVTSDGKLCQTCSAPFGEDDDKRFRDCGSCRPQAIDTTEGDDGVEAVVVDVKRDAPPTAYETTHYWCGLTDDAPAGAFALGGMSFQKMEGEVVTSGGGKQEFRDNAHVGVVHRLTDANVALIKEHVADKVIRNYQVTAGVEDGALRTRFSGYVLSRKGSGFDQKTGKPRRPYIPREGDRSLGEFAFMVKVRHGSDRPMSNPPPMVRRE